MALPLGSSLARPSGVMSSLCGGSPHSPLSRCSPCRNLLLTHNVSKLRSITQGEQTSTFNHCLLLTKIVIHPHLTPPAEAVSTLNPPLLYSLSFPPAELLEIPNSVSRKANNYH